MPKEPSPVNTSRNYSCWYAGSWCLTCTAIFFLFSILLLTIIFFVLKVPPGLESVTGRGLILAVLHWVIVPIMVYVASIAKLFFPWPIIVIIILIVALNVWGPDRIRDLVASGKFEVPGLFKYEGTGQVPEAFRKEMGDAQRAADRTNRAVKEAYESAAPYVSQLRERFGISVAAANLATQIADAIGPKCPDDYRLTVYIPDFVFEDRLYQLTEYFDRAGNQKTSDKSGRTYSIRYGIIGRVWRSGVAEIEGELISSEEREQLGKDPREADLIRLIARRWGLTLEEAVLVRPYESYGAIRIEAVERPVGIVFFYSKARNAFGDAAGAGELQTNIQSIVENSLLLTSMLELSREVEPRTRIRIFRNP